MEPVFTKKLGTELRAMLSLAVPVVLAQLTQMLMMISDTLMVARLGSRELAAVSVSVNIVFFLAVGMWMALAAINPVVAHFFGAGNHEGIRRTFTQTLWFGLIMAVPVMLLLGAAGLFVIPRLPLSHFEHVLAQKYITIYTISVLPLMGYFSLRYFLEGLGRTTANLVVTLLAVPLNVAGNWVLIFGNLGAPKLGVVGAATMTATVNLMMFLGLLYHVYRHKELHQYTRGHAWEWPDWVQLRELMRIGLPMGGTVFMEVSAFASLGLVMTKFGTSAVASHQIVMNVVGTSFMVPLGLSAAIAARSGQFLGARDPRAARFSAYTGVWLGIVFMALSSVVLYFVREEVVSWYTKDPAVAQLAVGLLMYGIVFQALDGAQVTTMGALRGIKDATVPMLICVFSYWVCGFAPAIFLAFGLGWGPHGIWAALPGALLIASIALWWRYRVVINRALRSHEELEAGYYQWPEAEAAPAEAAALPERG